MTISKKSKAETHKIYKITKAMRLQTGLMKDNAAQSHTAIGQPY